MQEFTYQTQGVCSSRIRFTVDQGILVNVRFEDGCEGNLEGLSQLATGRPVTEVIGLLKGIRCGGKSTSCPDQLAKALAAATQ